MSAMELKDKYGFRVELEMDEDGDILITMDEPSVEEGLPASISMWLFKKDIEKLRRFLDRCDAAGGKSK